MAWASLRSGARTGWGVLRQLRWWLLLALFLAVAGLGIWGLRLYHDGGGPERAAAGWDQLYLLAHLFTVNLGPLGPGVPWQLNAARFLGVAFAFILASAALATVFRDQFDRLRLRIRPREIVVLGLGQHGSVIALNFARAGYRVAAGELASTSTVADCRSAGIVVVSGDAATESLLAGLRLHRARLVVVTCGSDSENAEVAVAVSDFLASPARRRRWAKRIRPPLLCCVHIEDSQLSSMLLRSPGITSVEQDGPLRLTFFSPSAIGSPGLFDEHPILPDEAGAHLLLVGLGEMGRQFVIDTAHLWVAAGSADGPRLRVTVIDRSASDRWSRILLRDPEIASHIDVELWELDVSEAEFEGRVSRDSRLEDLTHVVICLDDDVRAAATTLTIREALRRRSSVAPIVVRMFQQRGLAAVLSERFADQVLQVRALALVDWAGQPELFLNRQREVVARCLFATASGSTDSRCSWTELPPGIRDAYRQVAERIPEVLSRVGCGTGAVDHWEVGLAAFDEGEIAAIEADLAPLASGCQLRIDDLPMALLRAGHPIQRLRPELRVGQPAEARLEALARCVHQRYLDHRVADGAAVGSRPSLWPWWDLPETLRLSNIDQAADIERKLGLVGCRIRPAGEGTETDILVEFTSDEIEIMARAEHERFVTERTRQGWRAGPTVDALARTTPYLVPWEELSEPIRELDREAVAAIPELLAGVGEVVVRNR